MLNNLFGIQELIINLLSGTSALATAWNGIQFSYPNSETCKEVYIARSIQYRFSYIRIIKHLFSEGFVSSLRSNSTWKLFSDQPCWTQACWSLFNLFTEGKSRAMRLAAKAKTDFKVRSLVVQYTSFKFMDMSGYLRRV